MSLYDNSVMPRIGLIADSHGLAERTTRAAAQLAEDGAEMLLHLGDICAESVLDALLVAPPKSQSPLPVYIVFGNMDFEVGRMARYAGLLGIAVHHPIGRLSLGDADVAFTHGHDRSLLIDALDDGVDYLFYGHTHVAADDREGETRMINPGALHRTSAPSVALLDTDTDVLTRIPILP